MIFIFICASVFPFLRTEREQSSRRCRFNFPQEILQPNTPHLYAVPIRNRVRVRIYFPVNDPKMNASTREFVYSLGSNSDVKVILDAESAAEYMSKYATKVEKESGVFETLVADALSRRGLEEDNPSQRSFSSFLCQQIGRRTWSAQEVCHVAVGIPSVRASHEFVDASVNTYRMVRKDIKVDDDDDVTGTHDSRFLKYLKRE